MDADVSVWWEAVKNISLRYLLFAAGTFTVFYILLRRWLGRRRIQRSFPGWSDYGRDLLFSMLSIAIFSSLAYLCVGVLRPWNHFIYGSMGQVSLAWHLFSFVWLFLLHDAYFYWIHRFMHHPAMFRRVHLVHHRSTNPSPWTAYAFHPLEALLEAGIIPLAAFTVPVHLRLFSLFMLFQIAYNVYGHLGYELLPHRTANHWLGRWINTSVAHNQHHKYFKGNYGLYTLIWDRLFGTLRRDYNQAMESYGRQQ
ncbi:MAG: sterol desaturase family protein [Chitinophagaceae bacterium]|jgi:sterol desaturase/sphingolipid hydroxylase (fatty acid hydroxylase superfamily)|nr:sterol desaturase family protein [Chitinophagaceae bacterium]